MSQVKYYWEDLVPGSVRELGSVTVSVEEIKDFAEHILIFLSSAIEVLKLLRIWSPISDIAVALADMLDILSCSNKGLVDI